MRRELNSGSRMILGVCNIAARIGAVGMGRLWLMIVTVAALVMVADGRKVLAGSADDAPPDALQQYVKLIEELSVQQRVNVLYPNAQSLFDGVPVGFVNTTVGNLTFTRRDIVTSSVGGPVVFARTYDSRIGENVDFGPGWRLSLAEEIFADALGGYLYVDGSGTRHRFVGAETGYVVSPPTPEHSRTQLSVVDDEAILREADDTVRTFERISQGGPYRIVSVSTARRTLEFRYDDGLLAEIKADGETLFELSRGTRDGRKIVGVTDRYGRSVRYEYADGRLRNVDDLAGNAWSHEYHSTGLLAVATDANGEPYLEVVFDESARVTRSRTIRGEYAFTYGRSITTVVEKGASEYTFQQNAIGATKGMESSTGLIWRIEFDDNNRVGELVRPDSTLTYTYNSSGAVSAFTEETLGRKMKQDLTYDGDGRLTGVSVREGGSDYEFTDIIYENGKVWISILGTAFAYEVSPNGLIERIIENGKTLIAEYDHDDHLVGLRSEDRSVFFERNALGRIVTTNYSNGLTIQYAYDDLGNRWLVEHGPGRTAIYEHDAVGNIISISLMNEVGDTKRQRLDLGPMNRIERIEYENSLDLEIEYDQMGRPIAFIRRMDDVTSRTPSETVEVAYTVSGRIARIESLTTGETWIPEDGWPVGIESVSDPRADILARKPRSKTHPEYGVVEFSETTFDAMPFTPLEQGVPNL